MAYVAFLKIVDVELNQKIRPAHLKYVEDRYREGKVLLAGPFGDQSGGMVIYQNVDQDEAWRLADADPAVVSGARTLTLRAWTPLNFGEDGQM